ncbi:MAG: tetratricopeptide repeat protein [Alphaproteobacteria bacterium]
MIRNRIAAAAVVVAAGAFMFADQSGVFAGDGALKGLFGTAQAQTPEAPVAYPAPLDEATLERLLAGTDIDPALVLRICTDGPGREANFGWAQSQTLIDLGWSHAFNERGPEALGAFIAALHVGPDRPEPYWGMGIAAYVAGLDDAVIDACFARTIAMLPDVAPVYADYGNVLSLRERWDDAIAAYEQALALDDGFIHAHDGLSNALLAIGDRDGALAHHNRSMELRGH